MTEEELKDMLLSMKVPEIDDRRKEADIRFALEQAKDIRGLPKITYWERLRSMAGYLSPWVWVVQAVVLLVCGYAICMMPYYNYISIVSMAAPLLACIGCVEIKRGYGCGMWEMEKACRYDLRQVVLLKMQITGGVDLLVICCLIALSTGQGVELPKAIISILIPYLLTAFVFFMLLCRTGRRISNYVLAAAGMFMTVGMGIFTSCIDDIKWEYINNHGEWTAILVLAAVDLLMISMRRFLRSCDREEGIEWNFD